MKTIAEWQKQMTPEEARALIRSKIRLHFSGYGDHRKKEEFNNPPEWAIEAVREAHALAQHELDEAMRRMMEEDAKNFP